LSSVARVKARILQETEAVFPFKSSKTSGGSVMRNRVLCIAALLLAVTPLVGCQEEGTAERAGKGVDNAVRDVKDAVNPPGQAEKAGRAVDDALKKP
jgi:hypothetical protein